MVLLRPICYCSSEEEEEEEKQEEEDIHTLERHDLTTNHLTRIFNVTFFGKSITTTVTSKPSDIRKWIYSSLYYSLRNRHNLVVGLGVQWFPNTYGSDNDPAETLQICIGTGCLIIQLTHTPYVPKILRRFLANEKITFVGIWNFCDDSKLMKSEHQLFVSRLINLSEFGIQKESSSGSMENLVRAHLGFNGVRKDGNIGRSNWNAKNLSVDQVQYATVDAHASFEIGKKLGAWSFKD
ncbi:hypothetical protein C5167_018977 [Papaver somniferum]|uniref:3'-5' exonuclease domain-containing protein n=1 Tax=Papaver somniferum TaxID=3469 RepID=A0A4Y7ISS8_PAPSO|nr:hypothetical protein C5167_018977 [Papaver somniferum]